MKKAFTMVELVFVIVVIGILSAVAIPKLAPILNSAKDSKAKEILSSVRSSISTERQKQILSGDYGDVNITNDTGRVFTNYDNNNSHRVLNYDLKDCTHKGCWHYDSTNKQYNYYGSKTCTFEVDGGRFVDKTTGGCTDLVD